MTRRGAASIVASPVLVGAVTTLVTVVAVFLAYNANKGLPFVPTYDLRAELPHGANLVEGNEVRIGGFRVGLVERITTTTRNGRSIAIVDMKLDKIVEPLNTDTRVLVRPRSALGLKYIELEPGTNQQAFAPGDTIPFRNSSDVVEFDDVFNTFNEELRENSRIALQGFGDAFSGRGQSLNVAIQELPDFFRHLDQVMTTLSDPSTELDQFFLQIGRSAAQVAPVARVQAELFANLADTFEAFSRNPEALRQTIERAPPTLDTAIRSFRVQRPFLADFADLSRRLRPAAAELPRSLPRINRALIAGQPVLRRSVILNRVTEEVFAALDDLAEDPNTLLGLRDLGQTTRVTAPLIRYIAPYNTVCNYTNLFFTGIGEHLSDGVNNGTVERILIRFVNGEQDNRYNAASDRPVDIPADEPKDETGPDGTQLSAFHGATNTPAIDARGNADCQLGQTGYLDGPLTENGRYPPLPADRFREGNQDLGGGSHVVTKSDLPGLAGPTFQARRLGIRSLRDVDRFHPPPRP